MMARYYDRIMAGYEERMGERRRALISGVSGTVLELGPGTGVNFNYLPQGIRWCGVEPNRHMHDPLRRRAGELGFHDVAFLNVTAEGMEQPEGSVDAVISTLVLCSVDDPDGVIGEVRRVLRPGGSFYFLEHVAAARGTGRRRIQRLMRPLWRFCADGCRPDRETDTFIRAGGFADVDIEEFEVAAQISPGWLAPHIMGAAVKCG
jgi:ubiquinone/menaquinone biosynthesis C-methylase UbiE